MRLSPTPTEALLGLGHLEPASPPPHPTPTSPPAAASLLAPVVSGMGLRGPWSGRRLTSPFPSNSGPSPPCSPCRTRSLGLPEEPCPTPSKPRVSMLGTGEQVLDGDACGPPSPDSVPLLHCSWGQCLLLPRELGNCRGALAASHTGVGLGPGLQAQGGRTGLQWCSGRGAPGPALPWDRAEVPWPVRGGDPSLRVWGVGVCNLGHKWGAGRQRLWLLFLPALSPSTH